MGNQLLFNFETDITGINIPTTLNNPFGNTIPEIARIAATEFQAFITLEAKQWQYNFDTQKGKMFGVLVVQDKNHVLYYLGTVSGRLDRAAKCSKFVPSIFYESESNSFMDQGMTALTAMSNQIAATKNPATVNALKEIRKNKSIALQQRLFENYHFINLSGQEKSLLDVFEHSSSGIPPSAAGECAAPKLLQYAIKQQLKPIALAEFWWGNPSKERAHKVFYPACTSKCRPILEYMLEDMELFNSASWK